MKLGVIADIHGNDVALRAVLEDAGPLRGGARPAGAEAGQELELHVAEVTLGTQLLLETVLEQANGLHEGEVGVQLGGVERRDVVGAGGALGSPCGLLFLVMWTFVMIAVTLGGRRCA